MAYCGARDKIIFTGNAPQEAQCMVDAFARRFLEPRGMEIHTVAHFMEDAEAIMMAGNCAVIFVEQLMSSKIKDIEALNGFLVRPKCGGSRCHCV